MNTAHDPEALKAAIHEAFADVEYPGDWCLVDSREGKEPLLLEQEFRGKDRWQDLDPAFIDQAPGGFGSALSFFSDEAFRFYLPAYLLADLDGRLQQADPLFKLTHGFDDASREGKINPRRYGERTWFDYARYRFATFDARQRAAIVGYLCLRRDQADLVAFEKRRIDQALRNYWAR
ncbi:MAG TPA: DUF6714 family protein [Mizugakiibacter sp.]